MPYYNDKVRDVVAVLTVIKEKSERKTNFCSSTSLRKEAIMELAETELRTGRYKNERSAVETLRDACTRRLCPDIIGIRNFDRHVDQWLRENSISLKDILLRHSKNQSQRAAVSQFFRKQELMTM